MLPFVVVAAGWWSMACEPSNNRSRTGAAATLLLFGLVLAVAGFFLKKWLAVIPDLASSPSVLKLIPIVAWMIGAALLSGGALMYLRRPALSLAAIGLLLGAADIANVTGFADYDSVLSSKKLVRSLRDKVGENCVWVSEGSKEIGASAGIAFYLGCDESGHSRSVKVMSDDTRRPPPKFPGPPAGYLMNRKELEEIWMGPRPVLFITDYQRTDWLADYAHLPSEYFGCEADPSIAGNRRAFANEAAWKKLHPELAHGK